MPIPAKLRAELNEDPFMHVCAFTGQENPCWHHSWTYKGKRLTERWAILPVIEDRHSAQSNLKAIHNDHTLKEYAEYLCLCRMTAEELQSALKKYPRIDWIGIFAKLKQKYMYFDIDKHLFS